MTNVLSLKNQNSLLRAFFMLCTLAFLAGCSFAPDYVQPTMDLPSNWHDTPNKSDALNYDWWTRFNDPTLNAAIEKTLQSNYDLLIAAEKLSQAEIYIGVTRASLFPTVSGYGTSAKTMIALTPYADYPPAFIPERKQNAFTLGFQASWELDFWGKYRNATQAARQEMLMAAYSKDALELMLIAQTAHAYFALLSLDSQLDISERTLKTREESLRIYKAQYQEGLINELDFLRASTEVDTVKVSIARLLYEVDNAETALQVLMGESPRILFDDEFQRGLSLNDIEPIEHLPEGIPSELLNRRPDILAAEASLKAANFNVGVAKSHWFPAISLTGVLGLESLELTNLFTGPASTWTYGASLAAPIFQAGRISKNVKISESLMREAALNYQKTVQNAFKEVREGLSVQSSIGNMVKSLEHMVISLTQAVDLAQIRYENGYASYLEVLDAQRSLFEVEMQLEDAKASHLSTIVNICMALGGGYSDGVQRASAQSIAPSQPAQKKMSAF